MTPPNTPPLALFDLDHTLLDGDGDDLWCRFLLRHGLLDASVQARNEQMGADYRSGRVSVEDFSNFYAGLLAGRTPAQWAPWQARFLEEDIRHRLPEAARALVASHREAGHTLLLTTASNSVIAERTAAELGFTRWIATELTLSNGVFTGQVQGFPNMREGKLKRLRQWLSDEGLPASALASAWFYSDSINDLPLLSSVGHPVAVNPDAMLHQHAVAHGWPVLDVLGKALA
ncbi:MAG: HAD family hydrolase [Hydrogenophaga sp.]|jgi:HAD superfamily hydrolase (TIGR01490 family)|uniref:HAD family hydrolase n=1 Tax=Hydrogenophaga sp. TaxID=1904254 RepID=UPI001D7140F3|nr:HAD family hydrolase [Hydrogenophaga sp.]MBW0169386.1 HAD-IB family hydrolase [Hydrogenophaga sp.]MBW0183324.1 HAD-IB family hydrolase [Hydrogenophaga sp.]